MGSLVDVYFSLRAKVKETKRGKEGGGGGSVRWLGGKRVFQDGDLVCIHMYAVQRMLLRKDAHVANVRS